jgi:hypothetical protein
MNLLDSYWSDAEVKGARPKAVYAAFEGDTLIYWTVNRRQAVQFLAGRGGGRLVRLSPA